MSAGGLSVTDQAVDTTYALQPKSHISSLQARERQLWRLGALLMASAIILGAFGAHAIKARVDPLALGWWETAASYHRAHALGLFGVAALWSRVSVEAQRYLWRAAWLIGLGTLLFSGSLYAMTLTQVRALGMITPIGGSLWIIAWCLVAWSLRAREVSEVS